MAKLSELGEYIYALEVFPEAVKPRFIGELPSLSDEGCGIVLLDGMSSLEYFAPRASGVTTPQEGESLFSPIIRFVIRTKTYPKGAEWSELIKDALHRYTDDTLLQCMFQGAVLYLGRSSEKLHEFQLTFSTIVKE